MCFKSLGNDCQFFSTETSGSSSPPPIDEESRPPPPKGFVHFHINERVARVTMWINQSFLVGEELESTTSEIGSGGLELIFASLRGKGQELHFRMSSDGNISLKCDNMDLCGDIVQALAEYLGLGIAFKEVFLRSK